MNKMVYNFSEIHNKILTPIPYLKNFQNIKLKKIRCFILESKHRNLHMQEKKQ